MALAPRSWVTGDRLFPPKVPAQSSVEDRSTIVTQLPIVGDQEVASGATKVVTLPTDMLVVLLLVDVPPNVDAEFTFDGAAVHAVTDGQGSQGGIPFGDFAARVGKRVLRLGVEITNNGGEAVNVRYVVIGYPGNV